VHGEAATCLLVSLLQNAARFSPEGAVVEIAVRTDGTAERVTLTVRDHGPGVPREHRDKIFEPFFTTAVDGLGMGLFVASRIADLQDMMLSVDDADGGGATFRVSLPVADADDVAAAANGAGAAPSATETA